MAKLRSALPKKRTQRPVCRSGDTFPCGFSCKNQFYKTKKGETRETQCKNILKGQAKNFMAWQKEQGERLESINAKRGKVGLGSVKTTPALMIDPKQQSRVRQGAAKPAPQPVEKGKFEPAKTDTLAVGDTVFFKVRANSKKQTGGEIVGVDVAKNKAIIEYKQATTGKTSQTTRPLNSLMVGQKGKGETAIAKLKADVAKPLNDNEFKYDNVTATITPARYRKDGFLVKTEQPRTNDTNFKTEFDWLAQNLGGSYTGREKGYVFSFSGIKKFKELAPLAGLHPSQRTREQDYYFRYALSAKEGRPKPSRRDHPVVQDHEEIHRLMVESAIKDGMDVPDAVLNDYPDLRKGKAIAKFDPSPKPTDRQSPKYKPSRATIETTGYKKFNSKGDRQFAVEFDDAPANISKNFYTAEQIAKDYPEAIPMVKKAIANEKARQAKLGKPDWVLTNKDGKPTDLSALGGSGDQETTAKKEVPVDNILELDRSTDTRGMAYAITNANGAVVLSGSNPPMADFDNMFTAGYLFDLVKEAKGDLYIAPLSKQKISSDRPNNLIFGKTWDEINSMQQKQNTPQTVKAKMPDGAILVREAASQSKPQPKTLPSTAKGMEAFEWIDQNGTPDSAMQQLAANLVMGKGKLDNGTRKYIDGLQGEEAIAFLSKVKKVIDSDEATSYGQGQAVRDAAKSVVGGDSGGSGDNPYPEKQKTTEKGFDPVSNMDVEREYLADITADQMKMMQGRKRYSGLNEALVSAAIRSKEVGEPMFVKNTNSTTTILGKDEWAKSPELRLSRWMEVSGEKVYGVNPMLGTERSIKGLAVNNPKRIAALKTEDGKKFIGALEEFAKGKEVFDFYPNQNTAVLIEDGQKTEYAYATNSQGKSEFIKVGPYRGRIEKQSESEPIATPPAKEPGYTKATFNGGKNARLLGKAQVDPIDGKTLKGIKKGDAVYFQKGRGYHIGVVDNVNSFGVTVKIEGETGSSYKELSVRKNEIFQQKPESKSLPAELAELIGKSNNKTGYDGLKWIANTLPEGSNYSATAKLIATEYSTYNSLATHARNTIDGLKGQALGQFVADVTTGILDFPRKMTRNDIQNVIERVSMSGNPPKSTDRQPAKPKEIDPYAQPTAKEFGDRLKLSLDDFKNGTMYLGVSPSTVNGGIGDDSGVEYRMVKNGGDIKIEGRAIYYKKGGDPIDDRVSAGEWKPEYDSYRTDSLDFWSSKIADKVSGLSISEKQHPFVTNANAARLKQEAEAQQAAKERRVDAEKQQERLTAWEGIKQEAIAALPKPKKGQSVSFEGTDGKILTGKADLYGENYAILKTDGSRSFSVADVKSGYKSYVGGLTATQAKEVLGLIWKEQGDKPVSSSEDVSKKLLEALDSFRFGQNASIPSAYDKEIDDRLSSVKKEKSQAMQTNLFGGLDEIPVDKDREGNIESQVAMESGKQFQKIKDFRPFVKPKKENISDKELERRIKEHNEQTESSQKAIQAYQNFYTGEGNDLDKANYAIDDDINSIFRGIDQHKETGNGRKIIINEYVSNVSGGSRFTGNGYNSGKKEHFLDPSNEKEILEFMKDKMGIKVQKGDKLADVRKRYNDFRLADRSIKERPKWMDQSISSVDSGLDGAGKGIGLTPTTKAFVADQLFKLNAFDFPSKAEVGKEPSKVKIRLPGGTGEYEIFKTKEAIAGFLDAIGMKPKKGETVFDALKRNAEGVQNFSEFRITSSDRQLLKTAIAKANGTLSFSQPRRSMLVDPRIAKIKRRMAEHKQRMGAKRWFT